MVLRHPAARSDAARKILEPEPVPCAGGMGVVNNRSSRETLTRFEVTGGPSYRFVADMASLDAKGCMLAGQSGQAGHAHAFDQLELWPGEGIIRCCWTRQPWPRRRWRLRGSQLLADALRIISSMRSSVGKASPK